MNCIDRSYSVITKEKNLETLLNIKNFPVFFGCTDKDESEDLKCNMNWAIDPKTGIIQLTELVPLDILYMEQHVDAIGPTWNDYNISFSDYVCENIEGDVIEIGGGSGKIANLVLEKKKDIKYSIIEPNPLCEPSERLNIIKSFFSKDLKSQFKNNCTIIFSQVYEHIYDPQEFLEEINEFLPVGGKMVFAYPNLEYWFKHKFTNAINFEHTLLMTDYFVDYFLEKAGFKIIEKKDYKNHSHFYTVEKIGSKKKYVEIENKYNHYKLMFEEFVDYHKKIVSDINSAIENTNSDVFLFGGHIFSQYLIMFGLNVEKIKFILDNSPLKQEKRLYGTRLIVKSPSILKNYDKPMVILKAGLYNDEIKKDILENINSETLFI